MVICVKGHVVNVSQSIAQAIDRWAHINIKLLYYHWYWYNVLATENL